MTDTLLRFQTSEQPQPQHQDDDGWPLTKQDGGKIAKVGLALFVATVGAGFFLTRALAGSALIDADAAVNRWFERQRTPTWNLITEWASSFSDTVTIVILLAVLIPALRLLTGRWHSSVLISAAVALETLIFVAASLIVGRQRPPVEQLDMSPPTASFPSGHTGAAFAFYIGLVVIVFWWTRYRPARLLAATTFGAVPVVVALARIYRGMHFPSDVVAGAIIGVVAVALFARLISAGAKEPAAAATGPAESREPEVTV